ncbi:hypothetical protein [Pseudomonas abietaniphila]|uniref:Uncharacterized protein n=1 Tax=Pseudomonas abietaniphila TaxID=89065 RepID=A0A1G8R2P5_9PSED|nr:hypothetical protein [Pseudomonas abietaniphila]SDJ10670.1 hypothetical protein SAMN05216605_121129 [Pseudomonas abietaniphila]
MTVQGKMFKKTVVGVQAATSLAAKLIAESAFFQMTPFPEDEFEFAIKDDRASLLENSPVVSDKPVPDQVSGSKIVHSLKAAPYVAVFQHQLSRYEVFSDDDLDEYVGSAYTLSDCEAIAKADFES